MAKIIDYVKQYIGVISIVLAVCILLTYSLSYFKVNIDNKRAAEMYIGELKYSIEIDGNSTNTLTVPAGETIVDIDITNLNEIKTYFKLLYLKNDNVKISYYRETEDISNNVTSYSSSNGDLKGFGTTKLKLMIVNNSTEDQEIEFKISGGYSTNNLTDVEVPSSYLEITTIEIPPSNTYFCSTIDTLEQGLIYEAGNYTYAYKQTGSSTSLALKWSNIDANGWGVQLTKKSNTNAVTGNICTYINNKPVISMKSMFSHAKASSIDLSTFNTSKITNMASMFYAISATTLDLSKLDTSNVTTMGSMFSNSKVLKIDLNNFNTSKVTSMGAMFFASSATTIDVSKIDTSNVTDMSNMFCDTQATTLDVSHFDTSSVTNMQSMFSRTVATKLDLSNFDTSNVTNMYGMFSNSAATSITGLNKFNTSKVTSMGSMFSATSARTIDVSNFDTSSVTNMQSMFDGTVATKLDLSNFDTSKVTDMSGMFLDSKATSLDVSSFDTSNVVYMHNMFFNSSATTITGLTNFNTSNVTLMRGMFNRTKIRTIDLSSFDTSNVTAMETMFYATSARTIYVSSKFTTDAVTKSDWMFDNATSLVGGNGTRYNSSYIDKTYARIDTASTPGYFTLKNN